MESLSLFDYFKTPFKINKPIRLIELFAGIGSQAMALKKIGADFEHYRICEFDKYAVNSYNAIHGTNFVTSDITQLKASDLGIVDTEKYCYIMTYSFPCQDLSPAGKQKGMAKGENTRSGLLWEVERLLKECAELPQVLLMENVIQVHGKKNKEHFEEWIEFLESKGYSNYWQDLNAKNFGIPQNRNRCFMVSLLGNFSYKFPEVFPLELRLKDMLEDKVDEKFYLSEVGKALFQKHDKTRVDRTTQNNNDITILTLAHGFDPGCEKDATIFPTLTTRTCTNWHAVLKENNQPKVFVPEATKKGYAEAVEGDSINLEQPNSKTRRGRVGHGVAQTLTTSPQQAVVEPVAYDEQNGYIRKDGTVGTLTTDGSSPKHNNRVIEPVAVWDGFNQRVRADSSVVGTLTTNCGADLKRNGQGIIENCRIRKLTPKECFRLMGFSDEDFAKAEAVNSNTQLYKQAGNSIVVDVLVHIFTQLKELVE